MKDRVEITEAHVRPLSVFATAGAAAVWRHEWRGRILVDELAAGVPADPKVQEGWIRSKMAGRDDLLAELILKTQLSMSCSEDEAVAALKVGHCEFKRDEVTGQLFIEGRQLKSALKEAGNIRFPGRKWGPKSAKGTATGKTTRNWMAEHIMVVDDRLLLEDIDGNPLKEATRENQRFVHVWSGDSIAYDEICAGACFDFTIVSDTDAVSAADWAEIWSTGELQGIGATRSQGFGRYSVIEWEKVR